MLRSSLDFIAVQDHFWATVPFVAHNMASWLIYYNGTVAHKWSCTTNCKCLFVTLHLKLQVVCISETKLSLAIFCVT